ncbi:MAG: histidine kinase dimerization/phospho-acceptor domain-containing protein [Vicinamibacterales bacterium]
MDDALREPSTDGVTLEEIYSQTREYLEAVLNNLPVGVIVLDPSFRITFFNHSQAVVFQRLGVDPSLLDLIGTDVAQRYPLLAPGDWSEARVQVLRGNAFGRSRVGWPVGHPQSHFQLSVAPIQDPRIGGAICTTEDITPFVKIEDELVREERMALIGQMAIGLNHEVNNPLLVILGQAESLMSAPGADPSVVAGLRAIHSAGRRIERVTRKLRLMEEIQLTEYVKDGPMMVDLSDPQKG